MPPRKGTKGAKGAKATTPSIPTSPVPKAVAIVEEVANHLDVLYEPSETLAKSLGDAVKTLYDHAKESEPGLLQVSSSLSSLLVDGFDSEQIWEQLNLQMEPLLTKVTRRLAYFDKRVITHEEEQAEKEKKREKEALRKKMEKEQRLAKANLMDDEELDEDNEDLDDMGGEEDMFDMNEDDEMPNFDEDIYGNDEDEEDDEASAAIRQLEDGFFDWDEMDRFADIGENENDSKLVEQDKKARRKLRIQNGELEEDDEEEEEDEYVYPVRTWLCCLLYHLRRLFVEFLLTSCILKNHFN